MTFFFKSDEKVLENRANSAKQIGGTCSHSKDGSAKIFLRYLKYILMCERLEKHHSFKVYLGKSSDFKLILNLLQWQAVMFMSIFVF